MKAAKAGSQAINGTIGVFMDEEGKPAMFPSIKNAIADLQKDLLTLNYSYPALPGILEFRESVARLVFPSHPERLTPFATTGGTGAVAVNLRLARLLQPAGKVILPTPAWANHLPMCRSAQIPVIEVPYIGADGIPTTENILATLTSERGAVTLLLQAGCHNPTGLDFSLEQMKEIAAACAKHPDCIVLLDLAYQGFKGEPEEDSSAVQIFADAGVTLLIAWSASKNHAIYGLRTGCAFALADDTQQRSILEGHYSTLSRGLYSAAPTFGQHIVARAQCKYADLWRQDMAACRKMLKKKREMMKSLLPESFQKSLAGYGMFAMLPLSTKQVEELMTRDVYFTLDGRINIAGIPLTKIAPMCERIAGVL